ncbi:NT-3 growth factor receptor [Liparis tanakae]|uniref:NT-3 growth factor receptor n=1 Tax=Liparis tanakae TaxID=230148 RepID=A0A4Z2DYS8_9TELE|nr:NT-3 growth factor receptor [Liparis tanakae]
MTGPQRSSGSGSGGDDWSSAVQWVWFWPLTHGAEISHTEYVRPDMAVYQDYTEGCLTFKNPTHHNNGNYTLQASNYLGVASGSVYGHFLDKPFEGEAPPPRLDLQLTSAARWGQQADAS